MKYYKSACMLLLVTFSVGNAKGEIAPINSEDELGPDQVKLDFSNGPKCSTAKHLFQNWGIRIENDGSAAPVVDQVVILGSVGTFLRNGTCSEPTTEDHPSTLMIFNFEYPVTEAVFNLSGGGEGVTAELKAYDATGQILGTLISPNISPSAGTYFGARAENNSSISKVTIQYNSPELEEQIVDFSFSYENHPNFSDHVPQIGDAIFPGGALRTIIVVTNLTNSTAEGQIELFSSEGNELDLDLAGVSDASPANQEETLTAFAIAPGGSKVLSTPGNSDQIMQGYAIIYSNVPIQTAAVFQILNQDGLPIQEAGIAGARPATIQSATVGRASLGNIDTGVALANISETIATVDMQLVSTENELFGVFQTVMESGTHMASFVPELFPDAPSTLNGSILIRSDVPIVATVIRTLSGLVSASLQVAQ